MKKRLIGLAIVAVLVLSFAFPVFASAANPTVAITVYASTISITNTKATWAIGYVVAGGAAVYFSTNGAQDDDWSQIENTGNQAVDIQIQGTAITDGVYPWTEGAAAGDKIYALVANNSSGGATYNIRVKSSAYLDITTNLPATGSDTYDWSMKFTPPTIFDAADNGAQKSATVTLVARLTGT
jgi:hypothetical protein